MKNSDHDVALVWLRHDLRLADHPALDYALRHARQVVCAYLHAPEGKSEWQLGGASRWWLHHSLAALQEAIAARGGQLILRQGDALAELRALLKDTGATLLVWNRLYEPAAIERDKHIKATLRAAGTEVHSFNGHLLFEPGQILNGSGAPYRVFTPFWRTCAAQLAEQPAPLRTPTRLLLPHKAPRSLTLAQLELKPRIPWDAGLAANWTPGEAGARAQLKHFKSALLGEYPQART